MYSARNGSKGQPHYKNPSKPWLGPEMFAITCTLTQSTMIIAKNPDHTIERGQGGTVCTVSNTSVGRGKIASAMMTDTPPLLITSWRN